MSGAGRKPGRFGEGARTGVDPIVLTTSGGSKDGTCNIDVRGDIACSGKQSAVVSAGDGTRKVLLHALQSPENWFEDFGSGKLRSGAASVALDPTFAETVDTATEYHVFLTPKGDCKGLFVTNERATGLEVRELGGGTSSVAFDYRIVAKRSGYENVRLEDVTQQYNRLEAQREPRSDRRSITGQVRLSANPQASHVTLPATAPPE